MKSTAEGDGSLLDNTMIVYGSGISDGNKHNNENLPILLAGRGGGLDSSWSSHPILGGYTIEQSVRHHAQPDGCHDRYLQRQHGPPPVPVLSRCLQNEFTSRHWRDFFRA